MGVLRYKIIRDLWKNKGRTLQVMLIIGLSAGAIGMIMGTRSLFIPGMQGIWQSMNPAMIVLFTGNLSQDELYVLKNVDEVVEIEGVSGLFYDAENDVLIAVIDDLNQIVTFSRRGRLHNIYTDVASGKQEGITLDTNGILYLAFDSGGVARYDWQR